VPAEPSLGFQGVTILDSLQDWSRLTILTDPPQDMSQTERSDEVKNWSGGTISYRSLTI